MFLVVSFGTVSGCASHSDSEKGARMPVHQDAIPGRAPFDVQIFLRKSEQGWMASIDGDLQDESVERVTFRQGSPWTAAPSPVLPPGSSIANAFQLCAKKDRDRSLSGYSPCNSIFYPISIGKTISRTVIEGVFTFGMAPLADAVRNDVPVTVDLDHALLQTAIAESGAARVAVEAVPLLTYRADFQTARTSADYVRFAAKYEAANYDPEALVAKARQFANQEARAEQEETRRTEDRQKALDAMRKGLKAGDLVLVLGQGGVASSMATIIEVRPPLVLIQWEVPMFHDVQSQWVQVGMIESVVQRP